MTRCKRMALWAGILCAMVTMSARAQSITEVLFPQYMQGINGTNNDRIPFAYRVTLSGLTPNATYRYFNQCVISSTSPTSNGFGNVIFPNQSGAFTRSTGPSLSTAGNYGEFTTDASGAYTGWFVTEPTGNAGFTPGNQVFMRINLNNGAGGTSVVTRLTTSEYTTVLKWISTPDGSTSGTGVIGVSSLQPKDFVFLYDNTAGAGRPIAGTIVESDGLELPDANYVDFHDAQVDNQDGRFGTIIPNILAAGVRRIEGRSLASGAITESFTSADGVWTPGNVDTVNPAGGKDSPLVIQAGLPDDPNISVSATALYFSAPDAATTVTQEIIVTNTGASAALTVSGAIFGGPNAARFSVEPPLPGAIAAGTTATLVIRFFPDGSSAFTTGTLDLISNDQNGDTPSVYLTAAAAPDLAPYTGLLISEIATQPTADEFVEIVNVSAAPIDLGGVILSDEDNNNSEGAAAFPAGTQIGPGEILLVAVNNSASEPSWLDTAPGGVRVFYDPARDTSAWTPANGNLLIAMNDYIVAAGGTSGEIALSSGDGVALYAPGMRFLPGVGPFPVTATLEGMNYPQGDTGPACPINSAGQLDTPATKAGAAQPASGSGLTRLNAWTNTNSFTTYTELTITPGASDLVRASSVAGWMLN